MVMGLTSAPVLMATQESTVRVLYAGATPPLVKMAGPAGSRELPTPVSVRLDGLASTVIFLVCHVKLLPNGKVLRCLSCVEMQASVWMLETHITAAARLATLGVTARNRWTNVHLIPAKMELSAMIISEVTVVSVSLVITV